MASRKKYNIPNPDGPVPRLPVGTQPSPGTWTFRAIAAVTPQDAQQLLKELFDKKMIERTTPAEVLPVAFEKGAVGILHLKDPRNQLDNDNKFKPGAGGPIDVTQVHLWRPQTEGWVCYRTGVARLSKLQIGVPYDHPVTHSGLNTRLANLAQPAPYNEPFEKFFDAVMSHISRIEVPQFVEIPKIVRDFFGQADQRKIFVGEIVQGCKNLGTWNLFRQGCPSAAVMWDNLKDWRPNTWKMPEGDIVYAIRFRATFPKGSYIEDGVFFDPTNHRTIPGAKVLQLGNRRFDQQTTVYWSYGGITNNMERRHEEHKKNIERSDWPTATWYRAAVFSRKALPGSFKWKMFPLLNIPSGTKSVKRLGSNGRGVVEQLVAISWFNSWQPKLFETVAHARTVEEHGGGGYLGTAASQAAVAEALRECFQGATKATGLTNFSHPQGEVGCNWLQELCGQSHGYEYTPFAVTEVYDDDGYLMLKQYHRLADLKVVRGGKKSLMVNPRPGPIMPNIPTAWGLPLDGRCYAVWEIMEREAGSHPYPLVAAPVPGPISDCTDAPRLGLRIIWKDSEDSKWYNGHPLIRQRSNDVPGNTPISDLLNKTTFAYTRAIEQIASLEKWVYREPVPHMLPVAKVLETLVQFDFWRREIFFSNVDPKYDVPAPTIVGGGSVEAGIKDNMYQMYDLMADDVFWIGALPVKPDGKYERCDICDEKNHDQYPLCHPQQYLLPGGQTVIACELCKNLGRCCTLHHDSDIRRDPKIRRLVGRYPARDQKFECSEPTLLELLSEFGEKEEDGHDD